jgi:hypothetical protein
MSLLGNNIVTQRRILARGAVTGPLGDYVATLPNQVIRTKGDSQGGPVTSPTVQAPAATDTTSQLQQIVALLQRLPVALSNEFRTRFIMPPRESVSFIVPGENIAVPKTVPTVIAAFQMNANFSGFLTHIGVNVNPVGAFSSVAFQLRVNGNIHPNFSNLIFAAPTLQTPLPFPFELIQQRTVQLEAINNSGGTLDISAVLIGWTEFMASYKPYGSAPQSGIA